jgi:uncharacterized RDD family membrane protein YckC
METFAGDPQHAASPPPRVRSDFRGTEADCLRLASDDVRNAAANGYVPIAQQWTGVDPDRSLSLLYELRPAVARQYLVASGSSSAGTAGPAPGWGYVGFWRRAVALMVDGFILAIPFMIVTFLALAPAMRSLVTSTSGRSPFRIDPLTGQLTSVDPQAFAALQSIYSAFIGLSVLFVLIQGAYYVLTWWRLGGTLGQRLLGIEIRSETDGSRIGPGRALLRYVGYLVSGWALGLGFLWAAWDPRKQAWHDKIAGTLAIRRLD